MGLEIDHHHRARLTLEGERGSQRLCLTRDQIKIDLSKNKSVKEMQSVLNQEEKSSERIGWRELASRNPRKSVTTIGTSLKR